MNLSKRRLLRSGVLMLGLAAGLVGLGVATAATADTADAASADTITSPVAATSAPSSAPTPGMKASTDSAFLRRLR